MKIIEDIEREWMRCVPDAIAAMTARFPSDRFYAAGFWMFYYDYTVWGCPCFGMNTERHARENAADRVRWSPPNWQFDLLEEQTASLVPMYQSLSEALRGAEEKEWDRWVVLHYHAIARVCRSVTENATSRTGVFSELNLPGNFLVGIFEERQGDQMYDWLIKLSLSPDRASALSNDS